MKALLSKTVQFKLWKIVLFFFILFVVGYNFIVPFTRERTYQEKIDDVRFYESATPLKYLEFGYSSEKNFWGDKFLIHFSVKNNAKIIELTNLTFDLIFKDLNGVEIERKEITLDEKFKPSSYNNFSKSVEYLKGSFSVDLEIKSAIGL